MRTTAFILAFLMSGVAFGQTTAALGEPVVEKINNSNAKATWYYTNGNIRETGTFLNGEKHGIWISYDENGNKIMEANYNHGVKEGNCSVWYSNGTIHYHMVYADGKRLLATEWNTDGQLIAGMQSK